MPSLSLLGLDIGLAHCGWSYFNSASKTWKAGLIATQKDATGTGVNHSEDAISRCRLLHTGLVQIVETLHPDVLCVESLSFPRNAGATAKIGMAWGVVSTLGLPTFHVPPMAVKLHIAGKKTATKLEVVAAVDKATEGAIERELQAKKIPMGKREHPYDASAVILAAMQLDSLRAAIALSR